MRGHYAAMLLGSVYAPLALTLSATSVSGSGDSSTVPINPVTITVAGGSGQVSRSWERVSGSTSITAAAPSSATTGFSASGLSPGGSATAVFRCVVTDLVTGEQKPSGNVTVYGERSQPSLSASGSGSTSNTVTSSSVAECTSGTLSVSIFGGVSPFTRTWNKLPPVNPVSINTSGDTASATVGVGPGQSYNYNARCTVTDAIGQTVNVDFAGTLSNNGSAAPSISASASGSDGYNSGFEVHASASGSPSGGTGTYSSHAWEVVSGYCTISSPSSQSTGLVAYVSWSDYQVVTLRYTVTDSAGNSASALVTVTFYNYAPPPGGFG